MGDLLPAWLLFLAFSILVVHICQLLVEQAAGSIDAFERRSQFTRASLCIGALVWCLDALGLFLYQNMTQGGARLAPAIFSLMVMILSARAAIPSLVVTRHRPRILGAGGLLALGMLLGHYLQVSALGRPTGEIRWQAVLLAFLIATGMAGGLALRHRSARLRAFKGGFRPLSWWDKVLGGLVILPLHACLTASVPLAFPATRGASAEALPVLLALVLFGVMLAASRVADLTAEGQRRRMLDRALSLVRSVNGLPLEQSATSLPLIAERIPVLLGVPGLRMHFQPIVPVHLGGGGIRFEALLRVEDPDLGKVNPELVFLACERKGCTEWADRQVLIFALEASRPWALEPACAGISVNLAPLTLLAEDFPSWVQARMDRLGLPVGWLHLEITEHAMIAASEGLVDAILRLREIGVGVVMDDFGAGFSSLGVLVELPLTGVKLDRALIAHLAVNRDRQALVRHLCCMLRDLRLKVTVEGVESETDLCFLQCHGADSLQGYHLAKPMPPDLVPTWLGRVEATTRAELPRGCPIADPA
nr:EAL domain-containing protein [uncultured Holophaga sp.]